ncbi:serine hydrolase domain-containing protein [Paenibacillus sp. YPG26]|uniref:serine hydrolase domain-containing protein n=1 Tax=Paenibacillus sp. YPG26 TaxID=2878915 RepID=UPI00203D1884|nr:serine hydrolase domain-containing protein [Paenibacillus sp. YPG26]USB33380.1 beta-lactamase family protein [Paenibacillus sp. YPG26]
MFEFSRINTNAFDDLNEYVMKIKKIISATAASTYIIHHDRIVNEWYSGLHDTSTNSRLVDEKSQFNIASIRKTYLGFAVSLAIYEGRIKSLDDPVSAYWNDIDSTVTIRHLLTHTHGLDSQNKCLFPPGTSWSYNNSGVSLLIKIIQKLYGIPLSELLEERVFSPCGFTSTGWRKKESERLVWINEEYVDDQGNEPNLFVSTKELAYWGYLHMNKGSFNGKQIIPQGVFEQATTIISPQSLTKELPRSGFFWSVQDEPRLKAELGDKLPRGSYQSLGITGCVCLVIPTYKTVAIRMYNQIEPNPNNYDYITDIKTFGNLLCRCIEKFRM